jgi:hypothetical protein
MATMTATPESDRPQWRRWLIAAIVILAAIAANVGNALTVSASVDTGTIAESFAGSNYFFPAGYVFATIWPVIYLGLIGLAIYQVLPAQADNDRFRQAMPVLAVNMIFNASWVFAFNYELLNFWPSLLIIAVMLVTAAMVYVRLNVGQAPDASRTEKILWIPLAMYFAWLTVATVANITIILIELGWQGFGIAYPTWGVIMIGVGVLLSIGLTYLLKEPTFLAVYAYAFAGVVVRYQGDAQNVALAAGVGAALLALLWVISLLPNVNLMSQQPARGASS